MKQHAGTKLIKAEPMTRGEYSKYRGWEIPENENPNDEGYLVSYSDEYESWSLKRQFEEAYRECNSMTFGIALELLKKGLKVARDGWNGKGMWLRIIISDEDKEFDMGMENLPYIEMKTADNGLVPWLASQTDMLAEDWVIVE